MKIRGWETWAASGVALVSGSTLPRNALSPVTAELITAVSVVMAALIPAMILAATSLRAGSFSVKALNDLAADLKRQINVFGGLFLYGLLTCAALVVGKAIDWAGPTWVSGWYWPANVSVGAALMMAALFGLAFLGFRSIEVIRGVQSVMGLQAQLAMADANARDARIEREQPSDLAKYEPPAGYIQVQDWPH